MAANRERRFTTCLLWYVWCVIALAMCTRLIWGLIPFPTIEMDEQAHYAYTAYLLQHHVWWPDFSSFYMYDLADNTLSQRNYLNHPPFFYWLMEPFHLLLKNYDPLCLRILPLSLTVTAFAIYTYLGVQLRLSLRMAALYALIPILLGAHLLSGFYSNDAIVILGGALVCLGCHRQPHKTDKRADVYIVLGLVLASIKLTSFMLVGGYVLAIAWQVRRQLTLRTWFVLLSLFTVLSLPYLYFTLVYGSPAPNTPGQIALLRDSVDWKTPGLPFATWIWLSLSNFADQFKGVFELTFLPLLAWVAVCLIQCRRVQRQDASPTAILIRAACLSTSIVLLIHLTFSYQRYLAFGWLNDNMLRYYFPLLPAYGLGITHLVQHICRKP